MKPHLLQKEPVVISGRAVSRGFGAGEVLCLEGEAYQFYKLRIPTNEIESEIGRFRSALELAESQLRKISNSKDSAIGREQAGIFETHILFLADRSFIGKIEDAIISEKLNAEWAVKTVTDSYVARYKLLSDRHLREKYIDLEDVGERLVNALRGGDEPRQFPRDSVIVAKEVNPSTLVELNRNKPAAIVTENGGWTSHTFILARELGVPAVTGVSGLLRQVETGDKIAVDGDQGLVILNPTDDAHSVGTSVSLALNEMVVRENLVTTDGIEIVLRANVDLLGSMEKAKQFGARGVGLYRSEVLFDQNYPTEVEQIRVYSNLAEQAGAEGIKIRTFDLGYDRVNNTNREKNPALGLRGVRLSLTEQIEFRKQIRSVLIASKGRKVDLLLPMISDIDEIRRAKAVIAEEANVLRGAGTEIGRPKIGAMVEMPASVLMIDEIAREVDFLNIGTNDLVQYILGIDRDNELVADWFRSLHPAVLRCIKKVVESGDEYGIPVLVCGEMAGSPIYASILVGCGVREFSMNVNSLARVWDAIEKISKMEAQGLAESLIKAASPAEVEGIVREMVSKNWTQIFDSGEIP